jgi:hypothetical protein
MKCCVLKDWHPMLGVLDPHDMMYTLGVIIPCIPHPNFAFLGTWPWIVTSLPSATCLTQGKCQIMARGTDIGPLIPHFMPNWLLPLILLTSASKSEFGVQSVKINVKGKAETIAVACTGLHNLNLNCAGAVCPPLPTGWVMAFNTHLAFMTPGDYWAGIGSMIGDAVGQFILNRIFGPGFWGRGIWTKGAGAFRGVGARLGDFVDKWVGRVGPKFAEEGFKTLTQFQFRAASPFAPPLINAAVKNVPPTLLAMIAGSPLGTAIPLPILGDKLQLGGLAGGAVSSGLSDFLRSQAAPQVPATPPAAPGTP